MFIDTIYQTILASYILSAMCLYTTLHILLSQLIPRLLHLDTFRKPGIYPIYEKPPWSLRRTIISWGGAMLMFNMLALPIAALYSHHYWYYIVIASLMMAGLFISDLTHSDRSNPGNPGMIAYMVFPMFYIPATLISIVLHLLGDG